MARRETESDESRVLETLRSTRADSRRVRTSSVADLARRAGVDGRAVIRILRRLYAAGELVDYTLVADAAGVLTARFRVSARRGDHGGRTAVVHLGAAVGGVML